MLETARQRVIEKLQIPRKAVLATSGPAGLLASEFPCQAVDLAVYLLVPQTSDHLFNLEQHPAVTLVSAGWELRGNARVIVPGALDCELEILNEPGAQWCLLVRVDPSQVHLLRTAGWGNLETYDFEG